MPFKVGQRIWIPCDVRPGMSPNEKSIRFEFPAPERRIVSGFAPERFVKPKSNGLPASIVAVVASPPEHGKVRVLLPGEVLTTTNPVLIDTSWLRHHTPYKKQSSQLPARRKGASLKVHSGRNRGRETFPDAGEATFGADRGRVKPFSEEDRGEDR